jgi:hypothetical protein
VVTASKLFPELHVPKCLRGQFHGRNANTTGLVPLT